ncbi:hypothetical protein B0H16DRAFT_807590 [Mycena metata]|uniref:Uncharacterized protein n=1 Tax=Mycena metata TaxID=1033252 RepID=A0AAD7K6H8_9AGAR|nr:hypothetical protein B0H16DRAFT_807590 [Mycena metata]
MLGSVVEEIKAKGQVSSAHVADVTVEDDVRRMIEKVVDTHGRLDVMVTNAGVTSYTPLLQCMDPLTPPIFMHLFPLVGRNEWERIMKINAQGDFLCNKHAGMQMITRGKSEYRMISASSVAGK